MDGRRRCLFYYYDDLQYRHLPHSAHTHTPEALTTGRSLRPFFPFSFWRLLFWFLYLNGPGCLGHSRRFRWEIGGNSSSASREWRYVYACMHPSMEVGMYPARKDVQYRCIRTAITRSPGKCSANLVLTSCGESNDGFMSYPVNSCFLFPVLAEQARPLRTATFASSGE
jgi:hypothetical protein